jgi:hypothetical protein
MINCHLLFSDAPSANFFTRSKCRGGSRDVFLDQPPRLREIRRLRDIYLIAQRSHPSGQAQLSKIAFVRCKSCGAMEVSQASIGPPGQDWPGGRTERNSSDAAKAP